MYKVLIFILFCNLILSVTTITLAQKPGLIFHQISVNDGLSENTVRGIVEDHKGFMWFGTEDGLNRYDGYKFNIYKNDPKDNFSLSHNLVTGLFTDSKKRMWVLTINGLNIYDPLLDVFYNFRNNKYLSLKNLAGDIEGISEDPNGNLWVTNLGYGLYKITNLNTPAKKYTNISKDNNKLFVCTYPEEKTVWVGTRDGLLSFDIATEKFTDLRSKYGRGYQVSHLHKDTQGNLWVSTTSGLKIITRDGILKEFMHDPTNPKSISGNNVTKVVPYKNNYLITVDGGGIDYFDIKKEIFHHYTDENESQLSSNNVVNLFIDRKGDLWASTYLNGINFSNATTNIFNLIKNSPSSSNRIKKGLVSRFLKDSQGNFWISTDGGGLYKKNKNTTEYINYKVGDKGLSSNSIISLMEDEEENIWATSFGGGLCKYDPYLDSFEVFTPDPLLPHSLPTDQTKNTIIYKGKLWISTYGKGVSVLNRNTKKFSSYRYDKFYEYSLPSDWVTEFHIDTDSNLWIGSFGGLSKFDSITNAFKIYRLNAPDNLVMDLNSIIEIEDEDSNHLWLATSAGLVLFNKKDGSYKLFNIEHGLSNNNIKAMIEDNYSNLWLSTNNGITKFNKLTKKAKGYTVKDGVPPSSFFYHAKYKDEQGRIYFGSNNGYLMIDPKLTGKNKYQPPIVITELKILNQVTHPRLADSPLKYHISETKEITLPYNKNSLTFEFTALNYNSSQNNKYAYYLEGFDNGWVSTNQRTATYTNLNPGKYTFKVKGSNNDNVWNDKGVSILIIITPPFYKTWWFNLLMLLSLALIIYLIFNWRTRRITNKNLWLEEVVIQRTSELKEANEQLETFVYKASHDIKGPLRSIIGLTTVGKKDVKDEVAINYFDHILKSTIKLDTLLRDLLEVTKVKQATIKPEKINFKELVNEAVSRFENLPGYGRFKFNVDIKEKTDFYSDKKLLYSIIQNLIENPIKYADLSKATNTLDIQILVSEKGADLMFKDNGIGIHPDNQKRIFDMFFKVNESSNGTGLGLYIVKTTVEKLNGTISVESIVGQGSTFYVKL